MQGIIRSIVLLVIALALLIFFYSIEYGQFNPSFTGHSKEIPAADSDGKPMNSKYFSAASDLADSGLKAGKSDSHH